MHPPRGIEFLGNFSQCMLVEVSRILEGAHVRHVACSRRDVLTEAEKKTNKENIQRNIKGLASE